jgi:hypothetical protein
MISFCFEFLLTLAIVLTCIRFHRRDTHCVTRIPSFISRLCADSRLHRLPRFLCHFYCPATTLLALHLYIPRSFSLSPSPLHRHFVPCLPLFSYLDLSTYSPANLSSYTSLVTSFIPPLYSIFHVRRSSRFTSFRLYCRDAKPAVIRRVSRRLFLSYTLASAFVILRFFCCITRIHSTFAYVRPLFCLCSVIRLICLRVVSLASVESPVNGVRVNGVRVNGVRVNGVRVNGVRVNGVRVNGVRVNGVRVNSFVALYCFIARIPSSSSSSS